MIPYGKQSIDDDDIAAVAKVLRSDYLTQGPAVHEFEKQLAGYCGAGYAVAVINGTAALHLAYLAAGFGEGDEVIIPANTFVATANMLIAVGAKPVFADIRLDSYNLDEKKLEGLITEKTKAIVPVHFAGRPAEMRGIWEIAGRYDLKVIEDASHALGAEYNGKKIGGLESDMSIFSFHAIKAVTTGEGGAVLTDDKEYYEKLISLRSHGIHKDEQGKNVMTELGYNYRMTDIQAALGISQLEKLDTFIAKRKQVARWYDQELLDYEQIILPEGDREESAWHIYVIRLKNPELRDRLWNYLKDKGIGANFHYPAVYSHPYYREKGFADLKLSNMEFYDSSALTVPLHPGMSQKDVKFIVKTIRDFFDEKNE